MKKTNKGFSLVELIIVIAIMAILAGAIAPALIRYIDKSRRSNDVSSSKTIKTAVETAMSNEDTYEALTTCGTTPNSIKDEDGNTIQYAGYVTAAPGSTTGSTGNGIAVNPDKSYTAPNANVVPDAKAEIGKNIGEKVPKIKFKKAAKNNGLSTSSGCSFYAYCSNGGTVVTGVGNGTNFYQLAPDVSKYYQ